MFLCVCVCGHAVILNYPPFNLSLYLYVYLCMYLYKYVYRDLIL